MDSNRTLRLGVGFFTSVEKFDPHLIRVTGEAELALNLYAPLVDYNDDGIIHGVIAEGVEWTGEEFRFKIKNGIKTISGHEITAKDVFHSLSRIVDKDQNTHGDLKSFICSDPKNECDGLRYDKSFLYLRPKNLSSKKFVLPLLAAVDHGIIPLSAFGDKSDPYKITSYQETTGAYYVDSYDDSGHMKWEQNTSGPRYNAQSFKTVETIPVPLKKGVEFYNEGKVDLVCMTNSTTYSDLKRIEKEYSSFETSLIRLKILSFFEKGLKDTSKNERAEIGLLLKKHFLEDLSKNNFTETSHFFPEADFGFLKKSDFQVFDMESLVDGSLEEGKKIKVSLTASEIEEYISHPVLSKYIDFVPYSQEIWTSPEDKKPDAFFLDIDSLFHEDISLLYYGFTLGIFGTAQKGEAWMGEYLGLEDDERRLKLRTLQNEFLEEVRVVPVGLSPYIVFGKPEYEYFLPKTMAGTLLWKIQHKTNNR